jgi:hypothetical protein
VRIESLRKNVASKNEQNDPIGAQELEGRYANYFKVGYNAFEFVLDFGQSYTEGEGAQLHTRIITSPNYAKALLECLCDCIDKYEQDFGLIANNSGDKNPYPN